jgi:2-keto-4-pentenoate hydratase/2-oxohepta-3-ene-1,7-dioic acid hydratase in catechol pathway
MRFVTWSAGSGAQLGVLLDATADDSGGLLLPLDRAGTRGGREIDRAIADGDLVALLLADPGLEATRAAVAVMAPAGARAAAVERDGVHLMAPLPRPPKVVCVGLNYRDHVDEQHIELPSRPTLFAKFSNAVIADGEAIVHHDRTHALDLEAELAVVIGRRARRLTAAQALAHVAGYTVVNDVSARDLQGQKQALGPGERGDGQWLRAKGSDTFLPMGPALVTADAVPDPGRLRVRSWRTPASGPAKGIANPMQSSTTASMIWGVAEIIEFISAVITLEPGDVIATGTPAGVGVFRDPPIFLEPGDVASVEVEGIGRLDNPVVDPDGNAPQGSPAEVLLRRHV